MTSTTWTAWLTRNGFEGLFNIKHGEPHTFDELTWSPDKADCSAAWEFYTELRTRITTQRLAYKAGDEGTALDSVYQLFKLSRDIIKAHEGCTHFATLTIRALNMHVRPFTATWHREKLAGRLSNADVRFHFRRELSDLQLVLRKLTHLIGLLAGDDPQIAREEEEQAGPTTTRSRRGLFAPLAFGIAEGMRGLNSTRDQINQSEAAEIQARRQNYQLENKDAVIDAVGLSISGGGIRSATFALGVVQQLARKGILHQIDYLSTVSGGGYLGAFISSFLNHKEGKDEEGKDADISLKPEERDEDGNPSPELTAKPKRYKLPFGSEKDPETRAVRQLRNHSKYLTEGGVETLATIVALIVYGMLTSALLLSPLLLTSVLIAARFFQKNFQTPGAFLPLSWPTTVVLVVLGFFVLTLPLIQNLFRGFKLQRRWEYACVILASLSVLFLAGEALPQLLKATSYLGGQTISGPAVLFLYVVAAPLIFGALALWLGVERRAGRILLGLFTIFGPMLMLAAFLWLVTFFITAPEAPDRFWLLAGLFTFSVLYSTFVVNINYASPHLFYRNRLARTYLVRPADGGKSVETHDTQKLSEMNEFKKAPYHLINCAINIPNSKDPDLRGRNTDFFVFSKHFCGGPMAGFQTTTDWEKMDSHLDLGTAMAISGAAAAPHMGTLTSARYTFLLALLNVRLGYWLRRPSDSINWIKRRLPPVAWYYYYLELSGRMSEKNPYVNLSDGGHIENLGIYELLRRRCKFVIAIDGEADPKRSFGGLLTLTQLAHIDLGVTIEPDLTDLRMDGEGHGRAHFSLSRIEYADGKYGLLLYIKSSLTGNESEFLKKYRADNPAFPHQSTAQQLFSEAQFEAYRALGEHIAQDLFRPDLVGRWKTNLPVREWFGRLSTHLLD